MNLHNPTRFRTRKPPTTKEERYLGVSSHAPPLENSSSFEFTEHDIFSYDYSHPTPSSSSNPTPNRHRRHQYNHHQYHRKASPLGPPDSFGILAALPENEESESSNDLERSQFLNNAPSSVSVSASLSSNSSSSSSRPILVVQRSSPDKTPSWSLSSDMRYYHSAPMNVPIMSPAMVRLARKYEEADARALVEEEEFRNTIPPHEFLSNQLEFSHMHSCSLFEGVGRTLKGRDLRQVRNAVLSQTGFIS